MARKSDKGGVKPPLRIVGDCHGKLAELLHLAAGAEHTICLGDISFNYDYLRRLADPTRLRLLGGNHDEYTRSPCQNCTGEECVPCQGRGFLFTEQPEHFLGDFGLYEAPGVGVFFFVRGAWSIDWRGRIPGVSWWPDEELDERQADRALNLYRQVRPDLVLSHTAPASIVPSVPFQRIFGDTIHGTRTESMLQAMYDYHQPSRWLFGHWHVDWVKTITHAKTGKETQFICLNELSRVDFPALPVPVVVPWKG